MKEPSEEFIDALCHSGSICVTCDLCGVTIFASLSAGDFEPGELEELKKKASEDPGHYEEQSDCNTIWYGTFNNQTVVPKHSKKCDEKIVKFEEWVLRHRYFLAKYLNKRAKHIVEDAKMDAESTTVKKIEEI